VKKLLAFLVAAALAAAPAHADQTIYISATSPLASDSNDGLTAATPWATLAKANHASPVPRTGNGNVTWMLDRGGYQLGASVNPDSAAGNGFHYHIQGYSHDYPSLTIMPPTLGAMGGITYRYVTFSAGGTTVSRGSSRDTLIQCVVTGDFEIQTGNFYTLADTCTFLGNRLTIGRYPIGGVARSPSIQHSTFPFIGAAGGYGYPYFCSGLGDMNGGPAVTSRTDSLVFMFNVLNMTTVYTAPTTDCTVGSNDTPMIRFYATSNGTVRGCRFTMAQDNPNACEHAYCFGLRDSSFSNTFAADTMDASPSHAVAEFLWTHTGEAHRSVTGTKIDSCWIKTPSGIPLRFQDGILPNTRISYTTAIGGGNVIDTAEQPIAGPISINHNTLVSTMDNQPWGHGYVNMNNSTFTTDTTTFYNNIVAQLGKGSGGNSCIGTSNGCSTVGGLMVAITGYQPLFKAAWNVYFLKQFKTSAGDRSIILSNYTNGPPGASSPILAKYGVGKGWVADSVSRYIDPLFGRGGPDTTFDTFNPSLSPSSGARYAGKDSSDAGAVAYVNTAKLSILSGQPLQIDFKVSHVYQMILANLSDDTVKVSNITSPWARLTVVKTTATLAPGDTIAIPLTWSSPWTPNNPGFYSDGVLTITSNDVILPKRTYAVTFGGASSNQ
jgi:hypothetical protein